MLIETRMTCQNMCKGTKKSRVVRHKTILETKCGRGKEDKER